MAKKKVFSIGSSLAQGLEETIESAQNYSGELRVDIISLDNIELDPENPRDLALTFADMRTGLKSSDPEYQRKKQELESLKSISASIDDQGLINPVTVYKHDSKYRLIAGERRTLASLLAGKNSIQARIMDGRPDELNVGLLQWIENMERADLSLWERLFNLEKIIKAHAKEKGVKPEAVTATEIARLINCSKPHASHYKTVLNATDDIKQLIEINEIKNLEKAAVLANIENKAARTEAIEACLKGATLKQLKAHISQTAVVKKAEKPKKPVEKRGRQTTTINFGATKNTSVAKLIINSILNANDLSHASSQFQDIDWDNPRAVANAFKKLLRMLEEIHA